LLSNFSIAAHYRELSANDRMLLAQRSGLWPVTAALRRLSETQVIREALTERYKFHQDLQIESGIRKIYLVGYWQAYRYAEEVASELRAELTFREPARGRNLEVLELIKGVESPVSIHIRRGDYALAAEGNIALPMTYYSQGIRFFLERYKSPTFFVFSDDMEFARRNLPSDAKVVFVDHNDSHSAHEDLRLMSSCRGNIIANSTFSWWAAWLNPNTEKTIFSPKYWHLKPDSYFPELLPPNWNLAAQEDHRLASALQ